jgi:uncharacterized protein YyaL (SSP411 family)
MNQLSSETSPYLLQHQHNPVHWFAWTDEAFAKAKAENKPIIVSIGYSTCHWCHVMERESFENEDTAAIMNEYFVCIKVDREERPDVDQIYMEVVQILSGNGGWPLNCFLLPDARPFFGGTYFPPVPAHGRPSWNQVLYNISRAYRQQPEVVEDQATRLMGHLQKANHNLVQNQLEGFSKENTFTDAILDKIFNQLEERFDRLEGGFGNAPKFPGTMNIQYLLAYHKYSDNETALQHALFSLDKMISGGIYDQIGGGFSRYATDRAWLIPHFEKMLYDNALLVSVLAEAYKITKKDLYKTTIEETLTWVTREMTSDEGGFYSALDADSEGVEGKFYVWECADVKAILGVDYEAFAKYYDVSEEGNWEENNILWRPDLKAINDKNVMKRCREKLFAAREGRIRPSLDDKILLSWNAMMCSAFCHAYLALQQIDYKQIALRNIDFLLEKLPLSENTFAHTYKNGTTKYEANLEDYAFLIEALLNVYQISFDIKYLAKAEQLAEKVIAEFYDIEEGLFFFTSEKQTDLILRKKDLYDSATPSGNSTMLLNLQKLAILLDRADYRAITVKMLLRIKDSTVRYASSFARWAYGLLQETVGIAEIAIAGENALEKALDLQANYLPPYVLMAATKANEGYALLTEKDFGAEAQIYICKEYSCQRPVETVAEAMTIFG